LEGGIQVSIIELAYTVMTENRQIEREETEKALEVA
jgi:hypothetical protein